MRRKKCATRLRRKGARDVIAKRIKTATRVLVHLLRTYCQRARLMHERSELRTQVRKRGSQFVDIYSLSRLLFCGGSSMQTRTYAIIAASLRAGSLVHEVHVSLNRPAKSIAENLIARWNGTYDTYANSNSGKFCPQAYIIEYTVYRPCISTRSLLKAWCPVQLQDRKRIPVDPLEVNDSSLLAYL